MGLEFGKVAVQNQEQLCWLIFLHSMEAVDEEKQAKLEIWNYALGFTPMAVVKCAIELQLAEVLETHGGPMTHAKLSTAVGCSPPILRRVMRYLIHRRFFKETVIGDSSSICYTQTPLSRLLLKNSMAAIVLLESSPVMIGPWHKLSSYALENGGGAAPFEAEHGVDVWEYASANPAHSNLINDAMACFARQSIAAIIDQYPAAFAGIGSLVDVGGGNGTALGSVVKAFPWISGINFDLPHVVSVAPCYDGIEHVAGNMFDEIPKADAAFLMFVLHDWSDEKCVQILKKCRDTIPSDTGKVIIAEIVIRDKEDDEYSDVRLALDMAMMAHTEKGGKERSYEDWEYVVKEAGFARFTVKNLEAIVSVIEAYP